MPFNNNSFNEQMANPIYNLSQQNSYSYNNNSPVYPFQHEYNNIQSFPNSHMKPHILETRTFSLDDKIKIQKKLKYLENILIKNLPKFTVLKRIKMLKDQCFEEQSYEPLKRYIVEKIWVIFGLIRNKMYLITFSYILDNLMKKNLFSSI